MRIDHVKIRFQVIKWSVFLVALALPFAAWFITADYLELGQTSAMWATLVAMMITAGILHVTTNYLGDGFARSYATGGSWDYLAARFGLDSRPADVGVSDTWTGACQLDRNDVIFFAEAGIAGSGIYVDVTALGRILIPWRAIAVIKRRQLATENGGYQDAASIVLDKDPVALTIPWNRTKESSVPTSIGIA